MAVGDNATATALEKLGILQVVDLRASTPAQVYAAQKTKLSTRMAIWQPDDGGKAEHLSDYAVFGRIPTVEHSEAKAATVRAVLAGIDSTKLSAHMGWTGWDEHTWVASISAVGGYAHASDFVYYYRLSNLGLMLTGFVFFCFFVCFLARRRHPHALLGAHRCRMLIGACNPILCPINGSPLQASNMAFLANVAVLAAPAPARVRPARVLAPGEKVHTVAFVTSDGDNIQLLQHNDFIGPAHYGSPERVGAGRVVLLACHGRADAVGAGLGTTSSTSFLTISQAFLSSIPPNKPRMYF